MRRSAPNARPSSRPTRPTIDGTALRAVLKSYQDELLDAPHARDVLLRLGVAGNPADQLLHAFRPQVKRNVAVAS